MDPAALNKYLYIERTPTWLVRSIYIFGIGSWLLIVWAFSGATQLDLFYRYVFFPIIILFSIYHLASFGLQLFYKRFNLQEHKALLNRFWNNRVEPSVDVFLPICGEDMEVLRNTWKHVNLLDYTNKKVYVLDDSKERCNEHEKLAEELGFTYLTRPNKGEMKKAGNLKYGYERSKGEFIAIFDADFAPHRDFLKELLPYTSNSQVGIVQSPQYFISNKNTYNHSALQYGAGYAEEPFYRYIQVTRDRFGGTICCGSNAIYRRSALDEIGGTVQIEHSEDARTGFALMCNGWIVKYVPVILAVGLCPDNVHSYFHQQHRWCTGSLGLMLTKKFWTAPIKWQAKFCYITGFMFYLSHPLVILFSFQLFWALFFYNKYISLSNAFLYYPHLIFALIFLFYFPIVRFRWGVMYAMLLQTYAYSHAVFTTLLQTSVGWVPTNAKLSGVSVAFRQATTVLGAYIFIYVGLIALAVRMEMLHLFNYNYYSVQFWLFYNLILSGLLLWFMYKTMEEGQKTTQISNGSSKVALLKWQLKTAGVYILVLSTLVIAIIFV